MSVPVILRQETENDLLEVYSYLDQFGSQQKFAQRLRDVLFRIEAHPELHGIVWEDVRAVRLHKFQYVVYYVTFADRVEVLAVLHGSRDEATWRTRT
jgi:toxin ParE1/3/4